MLHLSVVLVLENKKSGCSSSTNRKQIFWGELDQNKSILLNKNHNEVLATEKLLMERAIS